MELMGKMRSRYQIDEILKVQQERWFQRIDESRKRAQHLTLTNTSIRERFYIQHIQRLKQQ